MNDTKCESGLGTTGMRTLQASDNGSFRNGSVVSDYGLGCKMAVPDWVRLNRTEVFADPRLRDYVSPFPPGMLMQNTTGLTNESDFASHGADFWLALSEAAPKSLNDYASVLDFGCGCGRLARMFKGHPGRIAGCDIDRRHIEWCRSALPFMETKLSSVRPPIPFADNEFDAVISISIFTHLNEASQDEFLQELARVCCPGGLLFLTIHGRRALDRAVSDPSIRAMLDMPEDLFQAARRTFAEGRHAFVLQQGHLTTVGRAQRESRLADRVISEPFEYGITFIPESYVRRHWTHWFDLIDYRSGALHDFQDIVTLSPRKR